MSNSRVIKNNSGESKFFQTPSFKFIWKIKKKYKFTKRVASSLNLLFRRSQNSHSDLTSKTERPVNWLKHVLDLDPHNY